MSINLTELGQVYLVCGKIDRCQGIDSLANKVKDQYKLDAFLEAVFLFSETKKDRFKALDWDGQDFWLLYKRFNNGKLQWPSNVEQVQQLSHQQIDWLMNGFYIYAKINFTTQRDFC